MTNATPSVAWYTWFACALRFDDGKNEMISVATVMIRPTPATMALNGVPPGSWNERCRFFFLKMRKKYPRKNSTYPTR